MCISNRRNSLDCELKKLTNEQIIIFYIPSNALCSSNEFVQNILSIILSLLCVHFPLVQSANNEFLLMKTHRVLNRSGKCANMRYRKNQVFFIVYD